MRNLERLARNVLENGGATVNCNGQPPHKLERYIVSPYKRLEYGVPIVEETDWWQIANIIFDYLMTGEPWVLDLPGNYLGIWIAEESTGQAIYLDVARAYTSLDTALEIAKRNDQKSIYDSGTGECIYLS